MPSAMPPPDTPAHARRSLILLWALSGFGTLTLEMVWMREIALWAGNTVVAATLVMSVFFASAALGNLWGARLVGRKENPLACYGQFEMTAAISAAVMFVVCRWLWSHSGVLPQAWSAQLIAVLLLVGPSSFFSGVAFPSLAETFVPDAQHRTASGAPFYGSNLLGATLGVAAGGVLLPLWLGLPGAFAVASMLQLLGGLLAWRIARRSAPKKITHEEKAHASSTPAWLGWGLLVASGVLSLAAQSLLLVWVRQVLEGSIYAASGVLFVFIGGLGLGALAAAALRKRGLESAKLVAAFAGCGAMLLFMLPKIGTALSLRDLTFSADTPVGLLLQSLGWCSLILLPLTFCLGGVFPLAWEMARVKSAGEGRAIGTALALNKLGSAVGTVTALFALLPLVGLARGTIMIAWGYAIIAVVVKRPSLRWMACLLAIAVWQSLSTHTGLGITPDLRVVASYSGAYGPATVVDDRQSGSRQILLNSRQRLSGTKQALASQLNQSWVPLLLCRNPERVITIGMAAGISAAAALDLPIKELNAVELVPEVVTAAREHFGEWNRALFADPRAHVIVGDGRATLARMQGGFDAIICDLFFPSEEGSAHLYSRDFFATARSRLNGGGVFCVWLPCYQLTPQTAGVVIRTLLDVFPNAIAVRANFDPLQPVIGLLGSNDPISISRDDLAVRLDTPVCRALASRSPFFRSADNAMLMLAGDLCAADPGFDLSAATTDDHPIFAFLGPRQPRGKERLFGFPFLDWIGKRFPRAHFPSCDLGTTPPDVLLNTMRAGNFFLAAAASGVVLPGDTRPDAVRERQVNELTSRAKSLAPAVSSPLDESTVR